MIPIDTMGHSRFPHLRVGMNGGVMTEHLQRLLFEGTGLVVEHGTRPKVFVNGQTCQLQYPLRVRGSVGPSREVLVLGTMFADGESATAFEQFRLAPIASRCRPGTHLAARPTVVLEPLGLALSVFPVTDQLPTLVDVTDPERMAAVLGATPIDIQLVRFTRTPRCVLRYRVGPGPTVLFGKVASDLAPQTADVLDALAGVRGPNAVSPRGSAAIAVPRLVCHVTDLDLMLFSELPGARPPLGPGCSVMSVLAMAARAASAIHGSAIEAPKERTLGSEVAEATNAIAFIAEGAPALAAWLSTAVATVAARGRQTPGQRGCFAHGDFTPSQLLVTDSSVGVLDVDDMCEAEPAFDLGRFVAYARVALAKSGVATDGGLEGYLAGEYKRAGGVPTSPDRIGLYEVLSLVVMAVHSWQRLKPKRLHAICSVLDHEHGRLARAAAD